MNCLYHACSTAILSRSGCFTVNNSFRSFSNVIWRRSIEHAGIRTVNLEFQLTKFRVQCYSSRNKSHVQKLDPKPVMKEEKDAFFVVRKGDIVGVYKKLSDCQAQVGSSICDPPVNVYKGNSMPKGTAEYLLSCGLKNALYSIRAADLTEELFGTLIPCPFQEAIGSTYISNAIGKHFKLDHHRSCTLEYDGSSKGNPGQAGAGAVLRADDGSLIYRLREGLGIATNNVAEYRGMILGLRFALQQGFTSIRVQGDSKLVCMQIQGLWKVKSQNISSLYEEAKKLIEKFLSFQIIHVLRDLNSDADAQANLAVGLADGLVQEEVEN